MEAGESPGKTLRCIIPVLVRQIYDLPFPATPGFIPGSIGLQHLQACHTACGSSNTLRWNIP